MVRLLFTVLLLRRLGDLVRLLIRLLISMRDSGRRYRGSLSNILWMVFCAEFFLAGVSAVLLFFSLSLFFFFPFSLSVGWKAKTIIIRHTHLGLKPSSSSTLMIFSIDRVEYR